MRTARPVGLTDDGRFLIVETADGESISVPADESRTTLRNRPRRQHLETELDQSMTPREIQMKIRAGASVDEIAEASGMPIARVEAFAAPVMAERNHIAGLAQLGSVRRIGEPTGHRTLRAAVGDRLRERGVDPDAVEWDAFKMDDGRWSVSASYRFDKTDRVAIFYFDQRGRFSVSGNDEGRWAIGEQPAQSASTGTGSRTQADDVDTEPTLKLASPADELALLRAIETNDATPEAERQPEPQVQARPGIEPGAIDVPTDAEVSGIARAMSEPDAHLGAQPEAEAEAEDEAVVLPEEMPAVEAAVPGEPSQLDLLYDLLGSDGYAEDSIRVFEGLSDAAAVPDVADSAWQDAEEQDYPDEQPGSVDPAASAESAELEQPDTPAAADVQPEVFADGATQDTLPGAEPAAPETETPASEAPEPEAKAAPKPKKRKRASVPSWDEIMFGSPTPKGK